MSNLLIINYWFFFPGVHIQPPRSQISTNGPLFKLFPVFETPKRASAVDGLLHSQPFAVHLCAHEKYAMGSAG